MNLFPDKPVIRNYKTKEKEVVDRIKEIFPEFTWVHDKRVEDGCSKRRPDLLLDLGSHIIIIEIDENKYSYNKYWDPKEKEYRVSVLDKSKKRKNNIF